MAGRAEGWRGRLNPWRGLRGLPGEIWLLFTTALINRAGSMALPFLVLYLTRSLGFPAAQAGTALVVYGAGALVTAPLAGRLSDRLGPLRVMEISLSLSGLLMLLFPLARSLGLILALALAWAITAEAFRPANLAAVAGFASPAQRKAAFALIRLAVNLGMSVGPVVGGFLALASFRALFLVDGATSLVAAAVLAVAARRMRPRSATPAPDADAEAVAPATVAPGALGDPRLLWFVAAMVPVMIVFFQHAGSLPLFLVQDLGLPESAYGLIFPINALLIILLEVPLNLKMAAWPHGPALALGAFLCGAGFGGMAFAGGIGGVTATVVVWTFGEMILLPGSAAYAAEIAPPEMRGRYMGLYMMTFNLAFAVGPWIGIQVLDRFGGATLWSAAFVCCVLSAAMLGRIRGAPAPATGRPG